MTIHQHDNQDNLDTINQDLATSNNVAFNSVESNYLFTTTGNLFLQPNAGADVELQLSGSGLLAVDKIGGRIAAYVNFVHPIFVSGKVGADEVDLAKAVDGDAVLITLANNQANVAASTNETIIIQYNFNLVTDVARVVVGKEADYTSTANEDSFMAFYTDLNGTISESFRIGSTANLVSRGNTISNSMVKALSLGGDSNTMSSGTADNSAIVGGSTNSITSTYGFIGGGQNNAVTASNSVAMGQRAKANHANCFVWNDSTAADFTTGASDQVMFRALGGFGIGTPPDEYFHIAEEIDGDAVFLFENSQANAVASTNETVQLRFGFGGVNNAGGIAMTKRNDFSSVALRDSDMAFSLMDSGTFDEKMRLDSLGNLMLGVTATSASSIGGLTLSNATLGTSVADTVQLGSVDISAGNTTLALETEGTSVVGTGSPTQNRTVAIDVNGTLYYLLASTSAT